MPPNLHNGENIKRHLFLLDIFAQLFSTPSFLVVFALFTTYYSNLFFFSDAFMSLSAYGFLLFDVKRTFLSLFFMCRALYIRYSLCPSNVHYRERAMVLRKPTLFHRVRRAII